MKRIFFIIILFGNGYHQTRANPTNLNSKQELERMSCRIDINRAKSYELKGYLLEAADIYMDILEKDPKNIKVQKYLLRIYNIIKNKNIELEKIINQNKKEESSI